MTVINVVATIFCAVFGLVLLFAAGIEAWKENKEYKASRFEYPAKWYQYHRLWSIRFGVVGIILTTIVFVMD